MALAFRAIAVGQVPLAKGPLYTCPSGQCAFVRSVTYQNRGGNETVNLYVTRQGISKQLWPTNMPLPIDWRVVEDDAITLFQGDSIEGQASDTTDFIINGGEAPISDTLQT